MNYQDGILEVERLELAARNLGTADAARAAVSAAEALAASQDEAQWEMSARVKALALRLEFSLGFKDAFFGTSARLEEAGLTPLRRKAFRRNLAAMTQRVPDDPDLRAWRTSADLVPTDAEIDADV